MTTETPWAVCPFDRSPLIPTFEMPKKEWHCMKCGRWFSFFGAAAGIGDHELNVRFEDLLKRFKAGERGPSDA